MRTWKKGGLIGAGIWVLLFILDGIRARFIDNYFITNIISFPGLQIYIKFIEPNLIHLEDWIIIIPSFLFYSIVGILVSLTIQKMKSNNNTKTH
jgi:hypothetical protein